jgi:predicted DNA-binding ribbon-helix-helix protein
MQSLGDAAYTKLRKIADERDITVQELIRAIVIPDWLKIAEKHDGGESQSERHHKRSSRSTARTPTLPVAVMPKLKKKQ